MNRINQRGMELIQYKQELEKNYPEIVQKSLHLALEQMVQNKVIDLDTFEIVRDTTTTSTSLNEYLYTKKQFLKTEEEVFAEFEVIRKRLNKKLEDHGVDLATESVIDKDVVLVTKKFCINEKFTLDYFGVEEKDILKLMKRRGFVEKFAVLRLTSIFKPFMEQVSVPEELLKCDVSLVYFDKEENGYSIDIFFELPIEKVEKEEKIEEMIEVMKDVVQKAVEHYEERVLV